MNLCHPIVLHLSRIQAAKFLTFTHHRLYHSLSHFNVHHQNPTAQFESRDFSQDPTKIAVTHLSNCRNLSELNQIHDRIIRTRLLESYPSSYYWNNIMRSYTRLEAPCKALRIYVSMLRAGVTPDSHSLSFVLKAICQEFSSETGVQLHLMAIKLALESHEYCESGLINFYSKAGNFESALKVFDENPQRKLGSWNAIIGGLSQGGQAGKAIEMFMEMRKSGFMPNNVTMVCVTSACGSLGDLDLALQLHKCVFQAIALEKSDVILFTSLIDMYGKCGRMDLANRVFSRMEIRTVPSWTSLIVGHATQGHVDDALECFSCMRQAGVTPSNLTFVGVLSVCVHGGLVQEGNHYFAMMRDVYGMMPELQHYGCLVDLLGRAGLLKEAREVVERMPMKADNVIWRCLMGACEKHEDVTMGEWVAKRLQEVEPWNVGVYVVLSNIYASKGMWKEVQRVREIVKDRGLTKIPGYSLTTKSD